ncbi:hypothetical protein CCACVL1_09735 [Corchorus capsularis]|uniref:Uncharacterized protein n=1 Tax=Corchorus capsularis TaxID=210143 RepID=A0A1R3IUE4_COCAP|nr:hypothetical protein CCACVL1_09735 [Corchorus capsularis]
MGIYCGQEVGRENGQWGGGPLPSADPGRNMALSKWTLLCSEFLNVVISPSPRRFMHA